FAQVIGGAAGRIQFTPDLVPADLIGTRIYNPGRGDFTTEVGPVFCNLLMADEINRAPAKVQSALLEAMQERQVTIGKETHQLPDPFVVLATENPIETDGTYPLPEAQLDRIMLKVLVDYPSFQEEVVVVERITGPDIELRQVVTIDQLREMQSSVKDVYVDPAVRTYAATLSYGSRPGKVKGLEDLASAIAYGASPRASINMVAAARALAFMRGRTYVLPHDVSEIAPEVLRHRLVLTYEGIAAGVTAETVVRRVLDRMEHHGAVGPAVCQGVLAGSRAGRLAARRRDPLAGLGHRSLPETRPRRRIFSGGRTAADRSRQPRGRPALRREGTGHHPAIVRTQRSAATHRPG